MTSNRPAASANEPTFDVVIPCYNYGRYLGDAVGSVLAQDANVRVLVIDDCSKDETAEVGEALATSDPRVKFVRHPVNRGHIATYNEGIEWASGTYFLIVSADDLLMPGALAAAGRAMADAGSALMAFGWGLAFDESLPVSAVLSREVAVAPTRDSHLALHVFASHTEEGHVTAQDVEAGSRVKSCTSLPATAFYRLNRKVNMIPASGTVTRTDAQKRLGGYLATLPHSGDFEMWLRFAAHGDVISLPRFQVAIRRHASNMSRAYDLAKDVRQRACALDRIEGSCGSLLPAGLLKEMRRTLAAQSLGGTTRYAGGEGRDELDQLVQLAEELDPNIRLRWAWLRYRVKRLVGTRVWETTKAVIGRAEQSSRAG